MVCMLCQRPKEKGRKEHDRGKLFPVVYIWLRGNFGRKKELLRYFIHFQELPSTQRKSQTPSPPVDLAKTDSRKQKQTFVIRPVEQKKSPRGPKKEWKNDQESKGPRKTSSFCLTIPKSVTTNRTHV